MAFLKGKYVQSGTLDGSKIKLKNQDPLKGTKADGSEKEILKVNGQDKVEFPEAPVVSQDPQSENELARKAYVDAQREAAKAHADAAVLAEQALRQAGDSALDQRVAVLESSTSDRDYVDTKVAQEKSERESADAALDSRLDALEADPVTKTYVDSKDAEGKAYADQKIADLVNSAPATLDTLKELADAIAAGETVSQGLLTLIGQTDDKVDAEILNRQSADQILDDKIDQEIADRQAGDASNAAAINAEIARATVAEGAIDNRLVNVELDLLMPHVRLFEDNAGAYADGRPGVQDPNGQEGWYFKNAGGGQKINWYFFDGNTESATLGSFGMYAVITYYSTSSMPHLAVYSKPTGSGDAAAWYKSRKVFLVQGTPVVGKKYLVYVGQNPKAHYDLPRLQMVLDNTSSAGTKENSEAVLTAVFGSDSSASAGRVEMCAEELGINDSAIKRKIELRIKLAAKSALEAEVAARAQADAAEITARTQAVSAEASARAAADQTLSNQISSVSGALTQEISDRQAGDSALDARLDVLEADPTTKTYVDGVKSTLQTSIATEQSARISGDQALQTNINNLSSQLTQSTQELQDAIDGEASTRAAADTVLEGKIDVEKARVDAILLASDADKDSFAEIVQLINSVDTENDSAFASYVLSNNAALAQEVSDRQAADEDFLKLDGTREMTGHLEMGAKKIKNAEGIMLGYDAEPAARVHIVDGNQLIEGGGETAVIMKRGGSVGDTLDPIFALGRIVAGGIMKPVYRLLYSDAAHMERSVFEVESTGTVASVSDGTRRSHFEGYLNNGDSEPAFRLNSYPEMGLELGAGGSSQTDVAFRRNGSYSAKVEIGGDAKTVWYPDNVVIQGGAGLVLSGQRIKQVGTPQLADDAATKGYIDDAVAQETQVRAAVDQALGTAVGALTDRVDILEAAPALRCQKELKTLTSQDIANGYIDLTYKAEPMSMSIYVGGLAHHEGVDYTLAIQGSVTRVTFAGDLMPPSYGALLEGDMVRVQYMTKDVESSGGGGSGSGGGGSGGGGQQQEIPASGEVISGLNVETSGTTFTNVEFIKLFYPGTTDEITGTSKVRITYSSPHLFENAYMEFYDINNQFIGNFDQGRPDGSALSPFEGNITRGVRVMMKLKNNTSLMESGILEFRVGV